MEDFEEISGTNTQLETLKATKNLAYLLTKVVILEFGSALSMESHIIAKEVHFRWQIIGITKSTQEGQNAKSKFDFN